MTDYEIRKALRAAAQNRDAATLQAQFDQGVYYPHEDTYNDLISLEVCLGHGGENNPRAREIIQRLELTLPFVDEEKKSYFLISPSFLHICTAELLLRHGADAYISSKNGKGVISSVVEKKSGHRRGINAVIDAFEGARML